MGCSYKTTANAAQLTQLRAAAAADGWSVLMTKLTGGEKKMEKMEGL